jgi:hypothetical protein
MWDVIVLVLQCGAVAVLVLGGILSIKFSQSLPEPRGHLLDGAADVVSELRVDVSPNEEKWVIASTAVEVSPESELKKAA